MMLRSSILPAMGLGCAITVAAIAPAQARSVHISGQFATEHGATTTPSGGVMAWLNPKTNLVTYTIKWTGLSGKVTAIHFHGPAAPGQEADVLAPVEGPYVSPLRGSVLLSSEQAHALMTGQVYVNLHTDAYPNGEARAQLSAQSR
ncbi:CHRD domain-containing protein [Novacetimonas cocois]|uniref:CHRD domain-containing protein n=2 Tax=Novacetimonas cocois TaxID=1747507 RepID=A0A365YX77_9PROT|nr:CHRD domain-containing protein [Novacetimonas cocois]